MSVYLDCLNVEMKLNIDGGIDENTKIMLHMDEDFTDECGNVWTVNSPSLAYITNRLFKFGRGCGRFIGGYGPGPEYYGWISCPPSEEFTLADNDWTVDFWVRFNSISGNTGFYSQGDGSGNNLYFYYDASSRRLISNSGASGIDQWNFYCDFSSLSLNRWYHIAFVRNGNTPLIFINGVSQSVTETTAISGKSSVYIDSEVSIGDGVNSDICIEEFRFQNGDAIWTENFTVPNGPYFDTWADVTKDVRAQDRILCNTGISNNDQLSRVANTGTLTFYLDNSEANTAGLLGYYSPEHPNCRQGFETGIPVRIRFCYDDYERTKFYGRISKDGIVPTPGVRGERKVRITAVDWMNQASTQKIRLPQYTTNKRFDEVVQLILDEMPVVPLTTEFQEGVDTFVSVFDTVTDKTTALNEFAKLALSEYGYAYLKHTVTDDEVLVVESRNSRPDVYADYQLIPLSTADMERMCAEDYEDIITEDGEYILLEDGEEATFFNNTSYNPRISHGSDLVNHVEVTVYPRKFDTSYQVLYEQASYISLDAGETRTITASYKDPTAQASRVAGKDMQTPVSTTDYLMNEQNDGGGADLTADLSVTATFGATSVELVLENTGATDGYITHLQVRGLGIYMYDPVTVTYEDAESQAKHGMQSLAINMPYQNNPDTAEEIGAFELVNNSFARTEIDSFPFTANIDARHMMAFLACDIGSRIRITEDMTGFSKDRYIDGVGFEVLPSGAVKCTWKIRSVHPLTAWFIGIDGRSEIGQTTYVG